jgi:hypothetical protein
VKKQDNNINENTGSEKKLFGRDRENDLYFLKKSYD